MWMLVKKALLALFLGRTFGGVLAILIAVLAPLAGILKVIGLPILIVMLVVAAPALFVLAVIGLPIALVAIAGFVLMGVLSGVLTLSVAILKLVLPWVVAFIVLRFLWNLVFGKPKPDTPPPTTTTTPPETL
jgi:hypothetical protein